MKTLKSSKGHSVTRLRKSTPRLSSRAARARKSSPPNVRSRHHEVRIPVFTATAKVATKGGPPSNGDKRRAAFEYQAAVRNFEIGVRAFQKQNYGKAAEIFEKLAQSEARDIAERAHVHLRLCRQRTRRPAPSAKSAEEHYAIGVACLNARHLELALEHLTKADKMKPNQDHVRYALAVSHALQGTTEQALAHLEAAFVLRPENRIYARRDEDFQGLANDPRFRRLVYPAES